MSQTPPQNLAHILDKKCDSFPFRTALHYAAANVNTEVLTLLTLLIDHQTADMLNAVDGDGNTALMIACDQSSGCVKAVEILLQKGAAVSTQNGEFNNCLMIAASRGHFELVQRLLASDVSTRYLSEKNLIGITDLQPHQMFVNAGGERTGETALHQAAAQDHWKVLKLLTSDPKIIVDARNWQGRTPLMIASAKGNLSAVRSLLSCHADVNLHDTSKRNSLHAAASLGRTKVLFELLMVDNLPLNAKDANGDTALHIACQNGHPEAVRQILDSVFFGPLVESFAFPALRKTGFRPKIMAKR